MNRLRLWETRKLKPFLNSIRENTRWLFYLGMPLLFFTLFSQLFLAYAVSHLFVWDTGLLGNRV